MSRLQTGVLQMVTRSVGWEEVVAAATSSIAIGPDDVLVLDVPETLSPIAADPALLERSVANVVANALRHGAGAPVELRAAASDGLVHLEVIDHGPGVTDGQHDRLFEPFQRLGDTGGTGVGLGLAVAHGFVSAMGGSIRTADTPGGGLTVRISLPVADAQGSRP